MVSISGVPLLWIFFIDFPGFSHKSSTFSPVRILIVKACFFVLQIFYVFLNGYLSLILPSYLKLNLEALS